jgi:hypothetical protein
MRLQHWLVAGLLGAASLVWAQRPYDELDLAPLSIGAETRIPQRSEMSTIAQMAERLDKAMEKVYDKGRGRAKDLNLNRRELAAMQRLEALSVRAAEFRSMVERSPDRPGWSVEEFETLLGTYLLLDEAHEILDRRGMLHKDFRRAQDVMNSLVSYYGGYPRYGSRAYERLVRLAELDDELFGRASLERFELSLLDDDYRRQ